MSHWVSVGLLLILAAWSLNVLLPSDELGDEILSTHLLMSAILNSKEFLWYLSILGLHLHCTCRVGILLALAILFRSLRQDTDSHLLHFLGVETKSVGCGMHLAGRYSL